MAGWGVRGTNAHTEQGKTLLSPQEELQCIKTGGTTVKGKVKSFEGDKMQSVADLWESLWLEAMGFRDSIPGNARTLLPCSGDPLLAFVRQTTRSELIWSLWCHSCNAETIHYSQTEWNLTAASVSVGFLLCTFKVLRKKDSTGYIWLNT